ncbi:MAG TPA: hypothetical protein QF624_04330 [Dehalococcoidia bacterium]|nr:hypothetical protein [Dehalococcoidia bacterium]
MHVKIVPSYRRRGVGRRPSQALERALIAGDRVTPALEAATGTGFLVYPMLHENERVEVEIGDNGALLFTLFATSPAGETTPVLRMSLGGSAGWGGLGQNELLYLNERAGLDGDSAIHLVDALTTNVMPGTAAQIGFLGSYNFLTPEGWSTICMPSVNNPPVIPVMSCMIETDWYPQNTEFRSLLKRGETLHIRPDVPLGQVMFLPREAVELVEAEASDIERFAPVTA